MYLAWALSLLGDASTVDVASGAEVMVRGGQMAVVPNEAPQPAAEYSVTSLSGVRVSSKRTTFVLRYRPRTYYQMPNIADARRPLYLHQVNGTYSTSLSPRLTIGWSGDARAGDVTYASLARTFDEGTASAAAARLPLVFLSTRATGDYATGARNTVSWGPNLSYRSVLSTLPAAEGAQVPRILNVGMILSDTVILSRRDQFGVAFTATYSSAESFRQELAGNAVFGTALLNWGHRRSALSEVTLTGGLGATRQIATGTTQVFPVASAAHTNQFRWMGDSFSSSLAGGARAFVDPILATLRPQGFVSWSLTGLHSSLFSTQTALSAWTSITNTPIEPAQYESASSINFTGIFALSTGMSLRTGIMWQVRAPHLSQTEALVVQSQPTAFVALRGTVGTDRLQGNWL